MRAVPLLVLALLCCTAVAGCSNPKKGSHEEAAPTVELPELALPEGQAFGSMPAPAWKPGYHFRYEDQGAVETHSTGVGFRGNESQVATAAWGPRQGLNYTVVRVEGSNLLGECCVLALHRDANLGAGERPDLLSVDANHLEPHQAYVQTYCGFDDNCTLFVNAVDDDDDVSALDFPLKDGATSKDVVEHGLSAPYVPLGPVSVVTRVLGYNEVDGPFGKVRAVHVRQDFRVNFTSLLKDAERDAPPGVTDLNVTGQLDAVRDVLYAPDLLNIVLDQSTSEGRYTWAYRKGGQPQVYEESWRAWSSSRLVDASFDVQPPMSLEEVGAMLRFPTSAAGGAGFLLTPSAYEANVALGESVSYEAKATSDQVASIRIDVLAADGFVVSTQFASATTFRPPSVGPYLVVAYAFGADGVLLDRDYASLHAYYMGTGTFDCDPVAVDGVTGCGGFELPLARSVQALGVYASFNEATAGVTNVPGRLVIDMGGGQEISTDRVGSTAVLWLWQPNMDDTLWVVTYRPEAAVSATVDLTIEMWPESVPSWIYLYALGDHY